MTISTREGTITLPKAVVVDLINLGIRNESRTVGEYHSLLDAVAAVEYGHGLLTEMAISTWERPRCQNCENEVTFSTIHLNGLCKTCDTGDETTVSA